MAAPMRDAVDIGDATGTPNAQTTTTTTSNFDPDDNGEWDVGIGDLIIDLDADIEKEAGGGGGGGGAAMATAQQPRAATAAGPDRAALKMKIKRTKPGTKSSEVKHEIVKSNETNGEVKQGAATPASAPVAAPIPPVKRGSGGHRRDKARDKTPDVNGVTRPTPPTPPRPATAPTTTPNTPGPPPAGNATPAARKEEEETPKRPPSPQQQPAAKKQKVQSESQPTKETAEVCVGTSVGTITEPDCLGPCEPGTSVTLEGIVWHETEGGVLVVNVTWRGKTYVGTLLDCTRHDWAPPRFCDSPTEELDARTPKARAKRGRQQPDLANFTETRSSVHSKLRNGAKGRRAQPSPTPPKTENTAAKRKLEPPPEIKPPKRQPPGSPQPEPTLIECPEPNCSKKYKHANGLKYHRSHAHGISDDDDIKDGSGSDDDDAPTEPASPAPQLPPTPSEAETPTPRKEEPSTPTTRPSPTPIDVKTPTAVKPTALRFAPDESRSNEEKETPQPPPPVPIQPIPQVNTGFTPVAKVVAPPGLGQPPPLTPSPLRPTVTPPSPSSAPPLLGAPLGLAMERPKGIGPPPSPQFKVKTTASLMPTEERKPAESPTEESRRRNAAASPQPPERSFGREGVQSPAYSDISDDAPPTEADGATQGTGDNEPPFNAYPFYPFNDPKEDHGDRNDQKHDQVDRERTEPPPQQRKLPPQHFYPYGYVPPGFPYSVDSDFGGHQQSNSNDDDEGKQGNKPTAPRPMKPMDASKEAKHQNENHQILKESIEMKNQMGPYGPYQPMQQIHPRDAEKFDKRRYYLLEQQRRKEGEMMKLGTPQKPGPPRASPARDPIKGRDDCSKQIKEEPKQPKQEGQKPTTETTGPPPPPTSQYYLHPPPPFVQPPHYGTLPFDPMYRGAPVLVGGPFGSAWGVPRYHAPEDLSRPPYHSAPPHKIHELQERASGSPPNRGAPPAPPPPAPRPVSAPSPQPNKDGTGARSPPPQRHVHTHHHTHVGLGYPLYAPPYGAAVLASQQAVVSAFPPGGGPPPSATSAPTAPANK